MIGGEIVLALGYLAKLLCIKIAPTYRHIISTFEGLFI